MEENSIQSIIDEATRCLNNMFLYSKFVNEQMILSFREKLTEKEDIEKELFKIWEEMEILNACVLSDWEDDGQPDDYSTHWNNVYKKDAEKLIILLIDILKRLQ